MSWRLALAALALLGVAGCYRPTPPAPLGETVAMSVVGNQGQQPRTQVYVMTEMNRMMSERLGWRTSHTGTARLELAIKEERYQAQASDVRDIPVSWSVRIRIEAMLTTRQGTRLGAGEGTGNVTAVSNEPEALQAAAVAAAKDLEGWLENAAREIGSPVEPAVSK